MAREKASANPQTKTVQSYSLRPLLISNTLLFLYGHIFCSAYVFVLSKKGHCGLWTHECAATRLIPGSVYSIMAGELNAIALPLDLSTIFFFFFLFLFCLLFIFVIASLIYGLSRSSPYMLAIVEIAHNLYLFVCLFFILFFHLLTLICPIVAIVSNLGRFVFENVSCCRPLRIC